MQDRIALRKAIDLAYHERWCGKPLTCETKGDEPCQGRMDPTALDHVMAAIPHERIATTADGSAGMRRGVR
jgi:hypothetical protein